MSSRTRVPGSRRIRPKRQYGHRLTQPADRTGRDRFPTHKIIGVLLLLLAATLVVTHQAEHAGVLRLMPQNLEDLLLGFPMAGAALLAGFVAFIWR